MSVARYDTDPEPDGSPLFDFAVGTGRMFSKYAVALPHQCDNWIITGGYPRSSGVSKQEALADLKAFRAELDDAIVKVSALS
jgi:hypothetical protein